MPPAKPSYQFSTAASRARSSSPEKTKPRDQSPPTRKEDFYTDSLQASPAESHSPSPSLSPVNLAEALKGVFLDPHETRTDEGQLAEEKVPQVVTQVTKSTITPTFKVQSGEMGQTKIHPFKGLRDGKEDPKEYIEDIEWAYEQDYKAREPKSFAPSAFTGSSSGTSTGAGATPNQQATNATKEFYDKTHQILFRQNLESDAFDWYSDLDANLKQDWPKLLAAFLPAFAITVKDSQAKKFELRVKLANLKQADSENIAEYLKRAEELAIRLPQDHFDVGMATLKGMNDASKRDLVSFECNKDLDYYFATVVRLIKAAYSEVGKVSPFNPGYKDAMRVTLPGVTKLSNKELMRQVLINTNSAFPTLVQGMRALHAANNKVIRQPTTNQVQTYPPRNPDRPKKPLSEIKCFVCDKYGHYASDHNKQTTPPQVTAGVFTQQQEYDQHEQYYEQDGAPEDEQLPTASRCLFVNEGTTPAMAAAKPNNKKGDPPQKILQRPQAGVQKVKQAKGQPYNPPMLPQHILDQIKDFNESHGSYEAENVEEMEDIEEEPSRNTVGRGYAGAYDPASPPHEPAPVEAGGAPAASMPNRRPLQPVEQNPQRPPPTRTTKTGKVQELVSKQGPKQLDPIRGMVTNKRFDISQVLSLLIQLSLGELLDRSDQTIKELAYNMQRATPRYRIRKNPSASHGAAKTSVNQTTLAAAAMLPPHVTAFAYKDDGQSKPVMCTSWIFSTKLSRTLLDNGLLVELISRKKLNQLTPRPKVYTDGFLKVSLATDKLNTLTDYTIIPVNVEGVEATVKA